MTQPITIHYGPLTATVVSVSWDVATHTGIVTYRDKNAPEHAVHILEVDGLAQSEIRQALALELQRRLAALDHATGADRGVSALRSGGL